MENMQLIQKEGYQLLVPNKGYVLYRDGQIFPQVILGINATPNSYEAIQDENYQEIIDEYEQTDELEILKNQRIALSKNNLSYYLETHPMESDCHNGIIAKYNCTLEKQQLLMSNIMSYQLDIMEGKNSIVKWNSTTQVCEEWTISEMIQLAREMKSFVEPLVEKQQEIEVAIRKAGTKEEILNINVDF